MDGFSCYRRSPGLPTEFKKRVFMIGVEHYAQPYLTACCVALRIAHLQDSCVPAGKKHFTSTLISLSPWPTSSLGILFCCVCECNPFTGTLEPRQILKYTSQRGTNISKTLFGIKGSTTMYASISASASATRPNSNNSAFLALPAEISLCVSDFLFLDNHTEVWR